MGTTTNDISHYFHHIEEWAEIMLRLPGTKPGEAGSERAAIDAARRIVREQRVLLDFLGRMEHIRGILESAKEIGDTVKEVSKVDLTPGTKILTNDVQIHPYIEGACSAVFLLYKV